MTTLNEDAVEQMAIETLQAQGYTHQRGALVERANTKTILIEEHITRAIDRINPNMPASARQDALRQLMRLSLSSAQNLLETNQTFHQMLTDGINVSYQQDGNQRGDLVWLIDFNTPANNEFYVVDQLTIREGESQKRPDVILYINGLPLVVIELKHPLSPNATLQSAYQQLRNYQATIPSLFIYNAVLIISDGIEAKAGCLSTGFNRFNLWRENQLEPLIQDMLQHSILLDIIRHFIVFEKTNFTDPDTQLTQIQTVKKLAAYHQYDAANKTVQATHQAAQAGGSKKGGVIWHTQGSGKSLTMMFVVGKLVLSMDNPTILMLTDRNDLDGQLFDSFASAKQLLRQDPEQATSRQNLKELLQVASGGIIFATIQKFHPDDGNLFDTLSTRDNIVVLADEAHRTQYGFSAKTLDDKDADGNVMGQKTVYGFAKYMRDALPNATYLGFTGTPIEQTDINTPAVFGEYIHTYDIQQAVDDGATVPIYYESRLAKIELDDEGAKLIAALDSEDETGTQDEEAKKKWTRAEALIGSSGRIKKLAEDMVTHFEARVANFKGKGMVVTMSRRIAVRLYDEIIALRPQWHDDALDKGVIKIVMTSSSSDGAEMAAHHTTKTQREQLARRMKKADDALELVIVCDMWLTGFDVPCLHTMYIDKPLKGHSLMQAIARVNRVYHDKQAGLVVDYLGIAMELKKALSAYTKSGGHGDIATTQEEAVNIMLNQYEIVTQLFHGFEYQHYFTADTPTKLTTILASENHILGLDNGKKRFTTETAKLSQSFVIAIPDERAVEIRDAVAFFQAIAQRLQKFDTAAGTSGGSNQAMETVIRQLVDNALVSHQVINVFDAAGIKKPDISILSDEFLSDISKMEHKNIALELLRKILNDEIRTRSKKNLVQSRSLLERLENAVKKYHNKMITAAELLEELVTMAKDTVTMDKTPQEMGLTEPEYAFYCAVADNGSAKTLMQTDKLKELAIVIAEKVRNNASIDWDIKESARAKMRAIVKRTLNQYGYPPDMQLLATETVLQQAELAAAEILEV